MKRFCFIMQVWIENDLSTFFSGTLTYTQTYALPPSRRGSTLDGASLPTTTPGLQNTLYETTSRCVTTCVACCIEPRAVTTAPGGLCLLQEGEWADVGGQEGVAFRTRRTRRSLRLHALRCGGRWRRRHRVRVGFAVQPLGFVRLEGFGAVQLSLKVRDHGRLVPFLFLDDFQLLFDSTNPHFLRPRHDTQRTTHTAARVKQRYRR